MTTFQLRDRGTAVKVLDAIKALNIDLNIMHVCGTHQDTLVRFGLDPLLREVGIRVRQGPGCPVCVTTGEEIERAVTLARKGKVIASFGDMLRVPGKEMDLASARSEGADVRIVYSSTDVLKMARTEPQKEFVFLGIGFETTAPTTSAILLDRALPENVSILSYHRTVPPALAAIADMGELKLDGLIEPGHVSMVIGEGPYRFLSEEHGLPQVIAGFEPLDMLMACLEIARQRAEGRSELINLYSRVVRPEGNPAALEAMRKTFVQTDVRWRGFPVIPGSGLSLTAEFALHDASKRFEDDLEEVRDLVIPEPPGCRCGEVLRGLMEPRDCPLFGHACTPMSPVGPCMVSREGGCNIEFRWGKRVK